MKQAKLRRKPCSSTGVSSEPAFLRPEIVCGVQSAWQLTEFGTSETGVNSGVRPQRSGWVGLEDMERVGNTRS